MENTKGNEKVLLGQRIRSLRNTKGWTQQELGEHADVNYKFIGEIERGQQNPSFAVLVKIASALGVELQELFGFEQDTMDRKDVEDQINAIIQSLPDEDLGRVLSVLRVLYPVQ
jgi:transcriptional regulator with XRE-family HTH domain